MRVRFDPGATSIHKLNLIWKRKKMLDALTVAFEKAKNSCVKITLRNYIDTVKMLSESEYREAESFYIEALNRWS